MKEFGTTDRRSRLLIVSTMAALTGFLPFSAVVAQNSETSVKNAERTQATYRPDPITNTLA